MTAAQIERPITSEILPPALNPYLQKQLSSYFFGYGDRDFSYINLNRNEAGDWMDSIALSKQIIGRNNAIAELMQKPEFQTILETEKQLKGEAKVGEIFCVDGRLPTIHIAGRNVSVWKEGAGLLSTIGEGGYLTLVSQLFLQNIVSAASDDNGDLLEIFAAHTSFNTPHGCGRMRGIIQDMVKRGEVQAGVDPVALNLKLLEDKQIPAVTSIYNRNRVIHGKEQLSQVGVSAVIDTDSLGILFNYSGKDNGTALYSTDILREMIMPIANEGLNSGRLSIDGATMGKAYEYGAMKDTFTKPENFIQYYKTVVNITGRLLRSNDFKIRAGDKLGELFPDLTPSQLQALQFVFARTMAVQYLVGSLEMQDGHPNHPFGEHAEGYIALSQDGKTMGRFDQQDQAFGTSASSIKGAVDHIILEEGIMRHNDHKGPAIVFVSKPVDGGSWTEHVKQGSKGTEQIRRAIASNQSFMLELLKDRHIIHLMDNHQIMLIPVLIDQDTGEVLSVPDSTEVMKQAASFKNEMHTHA